MACCLGCCLAADHIIGDNSRSSQQQQPLPNLGLAPAACQDEIRKSYRRLCLQYHPDKNTHLSSEAQKEAEQRFKDVQAAYAQIGSPAARRSFDTRRRDWSSTGFDATKSPDPFEDSFRAFRTTHFRYYSSNDGMFRRRDGFTNYNVWPQQTPFKSTYVQRVRVPLQDLYSGKSSMEFTLRDNVWTRYCAAFRGGMAYVTLYQCLLYTLPLLRFANRWILAVLTMTLFHTHLPKLSEREDRIFEAEILAGYKEGTKLTFSTSHPYTQVVFVLMEEKHPRYRRVGNDLHVNLSISRREARDGCVLQLKSLDSTSTKTSRIPIHVPARLIQRSGNCMTIKGKGWPIRKSVAAHGDLVVHFKLVSSRARRKQQTSRASKKKNRP